MHLKHNFVAGGLKEFKVGLHLKSKKGGLRARSNIEVVLWKLIESGAGEKMDLKQSGSDQTNLARVKNVKTCCKVFDTLLVTSP